MKVVLFGSGNVATHLAFALKNTGIQVLQVWSRQVENAQKLAGQVGAEAIMQPGEIDRQATICIISVKDDAVPEVAAMLKGFNGLVVHTSGTLGMDVLKTNVRHYGVFYPLQTFSVHKEVNFKEVPLCLEAGGLEEMALLKVIAGKISNQVIELDSEKRKALHIAAVFACNFTNYLYSVAAGILESNGLSFNLLRPLIKETAAKVQDADPAAVQTGPAIRDDRQTMDEHMKWLKDQPELLNLYETLSKRIKKTLK